MFWGVRLFDEVGSSQTSCRSFCGSNSAVTWHSAQFEQTVCSLPERALKVWLGINCGASDGGE
jgi:hypothetical protein